MSITYIVIYILWASLKGDLGLYYLHVHNDNREIHIHIYLISSDLISIPGFSVSTLSTSYASFYICKMKIIITTSYVTEKEDLWDVQEIF